MIQKSLASFEGQSSIHCLTLTLSVQCSILLTNGVTVRLPAATLKQTTGQTVPRTMKRRIVIHCRDEPYTQ